MITEPLASLPQPQVLGAYLSTQRNAETAEKREVLLFFSFFLVLCVLCGFSAFSALKR
jgi:hypothetical protein